MDYWTALKLRLGNAIVLIFISLLHPGLGIASDSDEWSGRKENPANTSRLLVTNSNQSYGNGNGAILSYELVVLGLGFGLSDYINLTVATTPLPNLEWEERPILGSLDGSHDFSETFRLGGGLYFLKPGIGSGESFLLARAGGDFGKSDRYATVSMGFGSNEGEMTSLSPAPVFIAGGCFRVVDHIALVSENWIITGDTSFAPYSAAARFYWESFAFDLGGFMLDGYFWPWLSLAFNL